MPKVRGPLFSISASGKLGDVLVYQGGIGGPRVYAHGKKRDPQTSAQLSQRSFFQSAVSYWHALNEDEREFYWVLGHQHGMTGFNYFLSHYLTGRDVPPV